MNILRKVGIMGMLSGMGTMVLGVSEAAFCLAPIRVAPPYQSINNTFISCTTAAPAASGFGIGRTATATQPKKICSNLSPGGRRASVTGFASNGSQLAGCTKHDSTADNVEACNATASCATATQFQLTVHNN